MQQAELSPAQRELVERNLEFAEGLARRVAGKLDLASVGLTPDDCVQLGYLGLVQAAMRFDLDGHDSRVSLLDTHFRSFAYMRVRGAVIDGWRHGHVRTRNESGTELMAEWQPGVEGDLDDELDVMAALDCLPADERVIARALMDGATHAELSLALGVTKAKMTEIVRGIAQRLQDADFAVA